MLKNSYLKNPDFKYKALSLFVHPCYMEQLLNRKKKKILPITSNATDYSCFSYNHR